MRVDVVLRYIGVVMLFIAMFMLLSAGISYLSGMDSAFYPLLLSSLLTALLGAFPLIFVGKREQITNKEGFCIVVGAWLVACVVSMFPYLIWGGEFSLVNAWFESVSGLTTTGSTILNDIEVLPRGLQFWRMSSTWIGGMGVVMFALLILRGFWIALHARDRFGALLVVGFMTLTGLQTFLNIAVVTGLVPATGISLPFFSYGGTALLCQLAEMGIVLSVSRQMPAPENG